MKQSRSPIVLLIAALMIASLSLQMSAAPMRGHKHSQAKPAKAGKKTVRSGEKAVGRAKGKTQVSEKPSRRTKAAARHQAKADLRGGARTRSAVLRREVKRGRLGRERKASIRTASIETTQSIRLQPTLTAPMRLFMPPPMRGTHESLVHQNFMAEQDGLERILDDEDLADRIAHGSLVPVPTSNGMGVNPELPENRRYCRPWTAQFLKDLAAAHSARFQGSAILVTSAVRTVEFQRHLRTYNGNAAAAEGDIASPHLTGGTIDLAKQGMTKAEIGWLRAWLIPLEQAGKIDVAEEFKQACFHISVYKGYVEDKGDPKRPGRPSQVASPSMLAVHGR